MTPKVVTYFRVATHEQLTIDSQKSTIQTASEPSVLPTMNSDQPEDSDEEA